MSESANPPRLLLPEPVIAEYPGNSPGTLPVGERLDYRITWGIFNVASTSLEVLPLKLVDGQPAHHIRMETRTNGFADALYRVRDQIDSFMSPDLSKSFFYRKLQEGSDKRDTRIAFHWPHGVAQRTDYGELFEEDIPLDQAVYDPLGITYAFRMLDFGDKEEMVLLATDGRSLVPVDITIHGREVVRTPLGRFECYVVEPETHGLSGVFRKAPNASIYIWFHVDPPHIPVRLRSELPVGAFDSKISGISGPNAERFLASETRGRHR